MAGLNTNQFAMLGGGSVSLICSALLVWWPVLVDINPALEKACHRAVAKTTPFDLREVTTHDYIEDGPELGIAHGRLESRIATKRWAEVEWTCRANPRSGQVLRAEIKELRGAHRLRPAALPSSLK